MLRANLDNFAEFVARKAVINRNRKSAFQLRHYIRDPVELRLVCFLLVRRIDENKSVANQPDKFAAQIDRYRVEQLVREMNADESFHVIERLLPAHTVGECLQRL